MQNDSEPKKGDIINCNHCHESLYELQITPNIGDTIMAAFFKPLSEDIPIPNDGEECRCPLCGRLLFFTSYGKKL